MSEHSIDLDLPSDFDSVVRLFPLPQTVLFPGIVKTLHIFEPRYRKMMEDCLNSDRLITMAMLYPDQVDEAGNPQIAPVVCVGRVVSEVRLDDGRYNLMLIGIKRALVIRELVMDTPYRMAEVDVLEESSIAAAEEDSLREALAVQFRLLASNNPEWNVEPLEQMFDHDLPLARIADMVCYAAGVDPLNQQRVLETLDVRARTKLVIELVNNQIEYLRQMQSSRREFPPKFSLN